MNWKSTLALVALAGLSGVWLWKGDAWTKRDSAAAPAASPSLAALEADFAPERITHVEVVTGGDPVILDRAGGGWRMPDNWPVRLPEADELIQTLANLRTRFQPLPADDPAAVGLAAEQKPLVVKVTANGKPYTLAFGEPSAAPDDPAFTRPAFVRVNDFPEVLRLGPAAMPVCGDPPSRTASGNCSPTPTA